MPLIHEQPHIAVAMVLTGSFGQMGDPLDWAARQFGIAVKVDRQALMESLAAGNNRLSAPVAEAIGSDKHTRFRIQVAGRCEGQMVAICQITYDPHQCTLRQLENAAVDTIAMNANTVLGVQATAGDAYHVLAGIENDNPISRLLPLNVFNRVFFKSKIEQFEDDKHIKVCDAGQSVVVLLNQNWKFYDVPLRKRKKKDAQKFLPFFKDGM